MSCAVPSSPSSQRPETEAFEKCLLRALPPRNREAFLPPQLYCKRITLWLRALAGFLFAALALFRILPLLQPPEQVACDYAVPGFTSLPEETQYLFIARRALTVPDESATLQTTLAAYRGDPSPTARLLRFYLIHDPVLNPDHLAGLPESERLRCRVREALEQLPDLPVDPTIRAALEARLAVARWILTGSEQNLEAAWAATEASALTATVDRLDLQLFILHRLLADLPFTGTVRFRGAERPRHALEAERRRLADERNRCGEVKR